MTKHSSDKLSRRALIAGAAVGTVALAAEPASAQRCPAEPPPRTKGPLVWLDMDQHELDESYDQSVYAFNQQHIAARRSERNDLGLKVLGKPERVPYGAAEIEKVDIYKSRRANAPVMIYVHGGAWRNGRSAQNAYLAEPFVKAGAHFINVEFNNVGEVDGDIGVMVDQCRRAVAWGLSQRGELWRRSHSALSQRPLLRRSSRRLCRHHRVGEAGFAARHSQRRAARQRHVRSQAPAPVGTLALCQIH